VQHTVKALITACSELWKVLFSVPLVCGFLFVYEISWNPLNGFAPNSHGRHAWSSLRRVWRSKVKVTRDKNGTFWRPACGLCLVKYL